MLPLCPRLLARSRVPAEGGEMLEHPSSSATCLLFLPIGLCGKMGMMLGGDVPKEVALPYLNPKWGMMLGGHVPKEVAVLYLDPK